jgi:RNA polymerase sigma-70 factor, ECF subfamily
MDDKALVAGMLRGDERAFEEYFASYFAPMYRFALGRLGGNADAAEDVVQNAMSKAVRKLSTYRGEAMLLTWLLTFCRHEIAAYWREVKREPSTPMLPEDSPEVAAALDSIAIGDTHRSPETIAASAETSRLVQVALDRLPRHYADVLEWKYIEGSSVKEIAPRLGLGEKAAESMLTRARNAFRDAFTTLSAAMSEGGTR